MNLPVHRKTDPNTGGGKVDKIPQSTVYANNLLVSVDGSEGTSHPPCPNVVIHCKGNWITANGNPTVFAEGIPVNNKGDADTCGHVRDTGSPNVFWNETIKVPSIEFPDIEPIDDPEYAKPMPNPGSSPYVVRHEFSDTGRSSEVVISDSNQEEPPLPPPEQLVECGGFTSNTPINTYLSQQFTLGQVTTQTVMQGSSGKYPVPQSYRGQRFSVPEIICNLKALCENSLEDLATHFGRNTIRINSGFRLGSGSQHCVGMAADIQIPSWSGNFKKYYEGALWIKDNILYDQFIYEYSGRNPWYHISYNRVSSQRRMFFTLIVGEGSIPGIAKIGL